MEAEFWEYLERLVESTSIVVDRPKGSAHARFPGMIYPLDYGHLKDTISTDGGGIDVWLGKQDPKIINAFISTVDLDKLDIEIKIMIGCSESEMLTIQNFHNTENMRVILIRRNK